MSLITQKQRNEVRCHLPHQSNVWKHCWTVSSKPDPYDPGNRRQGEKSFHDSEHPPKVNKQLQFTNNKLLSILNNCCKHHLNYSEEINLNVLVITKLLQF